MRKLFVVLMLLVACTAQAHQMKSAITRVLFNDRTGNVEIMHRFYVHDAEHALSELVGEQVHLSEDRVAQEQFGRYVMAHFSMGLAKGEPLTLTAVGQEVDGKFIWVYQELPQPQNVTELWFAFDALQDRWPDQVNQINVEGLGPVRSLVFDRNDKWQALKF
ncbi:hypothetical protein AWR36_003785 [Microbulbifer flavimaris]|uniref:Uncharacterized protein n=1 Tax=Microbulbifer flavimaris TaxID=1781068 RepID=A0ABX4I533_9GAMM|nr:MULTISPECIES: DUF6702 family protein [Microbulbifer]KUJ85038.1 hypothetical protein AVO43_03785 [Microbulbifer sp. ZGT114]PCO06873.1 hypothetical protein AWR36_003785 [Microbulbifer flavimaris]